MLFEFRTLHSTGLYCDCFPGEPVPVTSHSLSEEPFLNIKPKLPLMQFHSVSSCPIAGHQRGDQHLLCCTFEEAIDSDEVTPQPSLNLSNTSSLGGLLPSSLFSFTSGVSYPLHRVESKHCFMISTTCIAQTRYTKIRWPNSI